MKKQQHILKVTFAVVMLIAMCSVYIKNYVCWCDLGSSNKSLASLHASCCDSKTDEKPEASKSHEHNGKGCCKDLSASFFKSLGGNPFFKVQLPTNDTQLIFESNYALPTNQNFSPSYIIGWIDKAHPPRGGDIRIYIQSFLI